MLQLVSVEERMQDGWEREERSSSFFYQNVASRASEKNEQIPLFFPLQPGGYAAGNQPYATLDIVFSIPELAEIFIRLGAPSGAAQGARHPAGTRGDIQAVTRSELPPSGKTRGRSP